MRAVGLELDAPEAGLAGIGGDADEGRNAAGGEPAGRTGHLDVLIFGVEHRRGELQPAVEQRGLPPCFIAVDLFRIERHEVVDLLSGRRHGRVGTRRRVVWPRGSNPPPLKPFE